MIELDTIRYTAHFYAFSRHARIYARVPAAVLALFAILGCYRTFALAALALVLSMLTYTPLEEAFAAFARSDAIVNSARLVLTYLAVAELEMIGVCQ